MDLVDAYFDHAVALVDPPQPSKTEQIDFRRAISAAYYAVFHLLTMTAAEHWAVERERHRFARLSRQNQDCVRKSPKPDYGRSWSFSVITVSQGCRCALSGVIA